MTEHIEPRAHRFPTLVDVLCQRAESQGDALLYRFLETGDVDGPVEEWTYRRLDSRARSLGARLRALGAQGERALLLYPPGLEFVAGFMGCLYGGVIAVPCYPPDPTRLERTLPRLRAIARDCGARYVLTTSTIQEMAEFLTPQAPELGELQWIASDAVPEAEAADWKRPDLTSESLAFLQYTSGSTGNPKGVKVSHANILHNESLITRDFGLQAERSVGVGWLPMFHDMGLIGKVLQPLYLGFPCVLMSPIAFLQRPLRWLEAVSHFKGTVSGGPNFAYDLCARKARAEDVARLDLSHWDLAFNGAEPVRRETMERFAETFAPAGFRREAFYPCYGLAEATLIVSGGVKGTPCVQERYDTGSLELGRAKPASDAAEGPTARTLVSSGQGAPDQRLLIVDPETRVPRASNEVGEVWVAGPSVAGGYWDRPEETAHAFGARLANGEGPFLRTGDLAFLSPEGELFITGRLKDLLIVRGRNLYPQDLEMTAERAHRAVRPGCSAAFSVDVEGEERLVVVSEVDVREGFDGAAVVGALRRALADEHQVHAHTVVLLQARSIPKTSSGKIQRRACRDGFLAGSLEVVEVSGEEAAPVPEAVPSTPSAPLRERLALASEEARPALLVDFLRVEAARVLRAAPASLAPETSLASLGLDSLMALELHGRLEEELGVSLPVAFLWQHPTLGTAAAHLVDAWKGSAAPAAPPLKAGSLEGELPLSPGQQRLWFLDRLVPESALYNVHFQLRLSGALDVPALERALQGLLSRHAVLRAAFPEVEGQPRQLLPPLRPLDVAREDLRALSPAERDARLNQLARAQGEAPFNLSEGLLVRAALVALEDQEHVLLMTQHHIVTDGWSIGVLARELAALYRAEVAGAAASLGAPALQYVDYARWQRGLGGALDGSVPTGRGSWRTCRAWSCPRTSRVPGSRASAARSTVSRCRPSWWIRSRRWAGVRAVPSSLRWRRPGRRCCTAIAVRTTSAWAPSSRSGTGPSCVTWWGSSPARWCSARTCPARPASGSCWAACATRSTRPWRTRTCPSRKWWARRARSVAATTRCSRRTWCWRACRRWTWTCRACSGARCCPCRTARWRARRSSTCSSPSWRRREGWRARWSTARTSSRRRRWRGSRDTWRRC